MTQSKINEQFELAGNPLDSGQPAAALGATQPAAARMCVAKIIGETPTLLEAWQQAASAKAAASSTQSKEEALPLKISRSMFQSSSGTMGPSTGCKIFRVPFAQPSCERFLGIGPLASVAKVILRLRISISSPFSRRPSYSLSRLFNSPLFTEKLVVLVMVKW